jgi:hypothetical protein
MTRFNSATESSNKRAIKLSDQGSKFAGLGLFASIYPISKETDHHSSNKFPVPRCEVITYSVSDRRESLMLVNLDFEPSTLPFSAARTSTQMVAIAKVSEVAARSSD